MIHFGRSLILECLHYFPCIFFYRVDDDDDAVNDVNDWGNFVN